MKYRKLRIAWSVAWGILCLLLVVLWVRSFTYTNIFLFDQAPNFIVAKGEFFYDTDYSWDGRSTKTERTVQISSDAQMIVQNILPRGSGVEIFKCKKQLKFWPLIVWSIVAAIIPWMRQLPWQYSLRTLLIGMTVAAIGLGWIVYAIRR